MIKIWNIDVKSKNSRKDGFHTIGIEEVNHELIAWKYWVGFLPKNDFFHHIILRQNLYNLMDVLLKMGTYSVCMKREDKANLYSANIIGISPYMLENVSGYERHTILAKFEDLATLGYISFTQPTRGETSEMNILLNEYNRAGLQVFQIAEKTWLNERMIVEKRSLIGEYEDVRNIENCAVELLPIKEGSHSGRLVELLPINLVDKSASLSKHLPIKHVNIVDDLAVISKLNSRTSTNQVVCEASDFSGGAKEFLSIIADQIRPLKESNPEHASKPKTGVGGNSIGTIKTNVVGNSSITNNSDQNQQPLSDIEDVAGNGNTGEATLVGLQIENSLDLKGGDIHQSPPATTGNFVLTNYPPTTQIVILFYQEETGLAVIEKDIEFINESLKISPIPQIFSAIQSAKVWRATLPSNFENLSEGEQAERVAESQPGFFLRVMGMKHVYNFLKNGPRYRKRHKRGKSTGVVSGMNRKRVLAQQTQIIKEIREKHKHEVGQIK